MKKLTFTKLMLIAILAIIPFTFYGQTEETGNEETTVKKNNRSDFKNYLYFTGDGGITFLYGDNDINKISFNAHLGIGYQFDNILGLKANFGYGILDGERKDLYKIGLSDYFDANLNLTINLTDIILGYNSERKYNVIPHVGVGMLHYRIRLTDMNDKIVYKAGYNKKNDDPTNQPGKGLGNRKVVASIPMGLEVNYQFNPHWGIFLDYTTNYVDTDLLDGMALGKRNDWFSTLNIGAIYKLQPNVIKNILRDKKYCNYWFLTMDGGITSLFGDNDPKVRDSRGNFNIGGGYHFTNFLNVYGKLGYGILHGQQENGFTLDYCDYLSANLNLSVDLINVILGYNENRLIEVSPHIGIGQIQYRARATANGNEIQLGYKDSGNKGKGIADRRIVLTVPMGVEVAYKMKPQWDIFLDGTTNLCNSDIVDCYSMGDNEDWYATFNIGLRYKFKNSCVRAAQKEEKDNYYITPEDVKQAVKEVLDEIEANKVETTVTIPDTVKTSVIYHRNYTNINFPVGKSMKIKSQTNIDALNRAEADINNGFKVESILVEGYSSPEGSKEINDRLSQERANQTVDFIKQELGSSTNDTDIQISAKGADWEGLINAIKGSDINDKDEIANKIENASNREQTLRSLMSKYPQIRTLLPQLRRAGVTITTVK